MSARFHIVAESLYESGRRDFSAYPASTREDADRWAFRLADQVGIEQRNLISGLYYRIVAVRIEEQQ